MRFKQVTSGQDLNVWGKKLIWQLVLSTEIIGQLKLLGAEVKKSQVLVMSLGLNVLPVSQAQIYCQD